MTDKPADDTPADDDLGSDEPPPEPSAPATRVAQPGRLVRIGAIVLLGYGLLVVFLGGSTAADPDNVQCNQARTILEDEDEVDDGDDIPCDEALSRATALDDADEDDEVDAVPEISTIRTVALLFGAVGLLQMVGAALTARLRTKRARLVALVGAALGIVFSPLGLLAVPVLGFVVYALLFSGDARTVFGDPGGPRMFRPRV